MCGRRIWSRMARPPAWSGVSLGLLLVVAVATTQTQAPARAGAEETPLIPREVLFGNPDKASPQISPDGTRLAFLAPVDGVLNVWVGPIDDPDAAKPVTEDKKRGIRGYGWAYDNQHIGYVQDKELIINKISK